MKDNTIQSRRAVEALRAGVPNRDAVRFLEPSQPELIDAFDRAMDEALFSWEEDEQVKGLLLQGDFGSGKSHLLEYYRHQALENNFVCSRVVLNKETPLFDLDKVYRACVESAEAPGEQLGSALDVLAFNYDFDYSSRYRDFFQWVHRSRELDPRLPASLCIFEHLHSDEIMESILSEWRGYPMKVSQMRAALREAGFGREYSIGRPQKGSAMQRFEFLTRFFYSAGYAGWVLLFDEAEIISRYSLRQRARAYSHLAGFVGALKKKVSPIPGLAAVFTITKDYAGQVLYHKKRDKISIPEKLRDTAYEDWIEAAEIGMGVIENKGRDILAPTRAQITEMHDRLRSLYADAYSWEPPRVDDSREYLSSTAMRQYIRTWINAWDLLRLYGYQAETVYDDVTIGYDEDTDLQTEETE
ncbi:MAG: DUF2791 family P-loop domain-containing protein [bacterium]|nr:DUF2791 family P-loop domain-containing protein [bacterium]